LGISEKGVLGFFEAHQNTDPTLRTFARNLQAGNDPKSFDSETIMPKPLLAEIASIQLDI